MTSVSTHRFFIIRRAVNFRDHTAVTALAKLIRETVGEGMPIRMVVIDTLARAMPGADENSAQEVGLVIAECDWLKDELDYHRLPGASLRQRRDQRRPRHLGAARGLGYGVRDPLRRPRAPS